VIWGRQRPVPGMIGPRRFSWGGGRKAADILARMDITWVQLRTRTLGTRIEQGVRKRDGKMMMTEGFANAKRRRGAKSLRRSVRWKGNLADLWFTEGGM